MASQLQFSSNVLDVFFCLAALLQSLFSWHTQVDIAKCTIKCKLYLYSVGGIQTEMITEEKQSKLCKRAAKRKNTQRLIKIVTDQP